MLFEWEIYYFAVVTTFSDIKQINLKQLVIEKLRREAEDVKRDQVKFYSL